MITKISGQLQSLGTDSVTISVDPFEYTILIPEFTRRRLQNQVGEIISLHTIHYLEGNPVQGRLTPRLVGFLNENEREFFALFCSVDGVGAKKALRAMVRPVREVAEMIEEQNASGLTQLPGVGAATADRVIAKLRRKVPKFALLVAQETELQADVGRDVVSETFEILRSLGHSDSDARRLLDDALQAKKRYKDVEALLQAVYAKSHA